ncbi:Unknown protein, partial [Striga hermonthica]
RRKQNNFACTPSTSLGRPNQPPAPFHSPRELGRCLCRACAAVQRAAHASAPCADLARVVARQPR